MKTQEQMVQIRTLKSLITKMVESHKATKVVARMSSNAEGFILYKTAHAQNDFCYERIQLFISYIAYYILRHGVENIDEYVNALKAQLKPEKKIRDKENCYTMEFFGFKETREIGPGWKVSHGSLNDAVKACISCLNQYIEKNGEQDKA